MIHFWIGFLFGFSLFALPAWFGFTHSVRDQDRLQLNYLRDWLIDNLKGDKKSLRNILAILISIFVIILAIDLKLTFDSDESYSIDRKIADIGWLIALFISGAIFGVASGSWLVQALDQSDHIVWSGIAIAAGLLFVSIIILDKEHGWLSRLKSIGAFDVRIDLSPTNQGSEGAPRSIEGSSSASSINRPGLPNLAIALAHFQGLKAAPKRDLKYATLADLSKGIKNESSFVYFGDEWVEPIYERLAILNQYKNSSTIKFLISDKFINNLRLYWLTNEKSGSKIRQIITKELNNEFSLFIKSIDNSIRPLCLLKDDDDNLKKLCGKKYKKLWTDCSDKSSRSDECHDRLNVFNHMNQDAYWATLTSLILYSSNEIESAIQILHNWLQQEPINASEDKENQWLIEVQRLRVAHLAALLSGLSGTTEDREVALGYHAIAMNIGERLLGEADPDPKQGIRQSYNKKQAGNNNHPSCEQDVPFSMQNRIERLDKKGLSIDSGELSKNLRRLILVIFSMKNTYVYEYMSTPSLMDIEVYKNNQIKNNVEHLESLNFDCFRRIYRDFGLTENEINDNLSNTKSAFFDTIALYRTSMTTRKLKDADIREASEHYCKAQTANNNASDAMSIIIENKSLSPSKDYAERRSQIVTRINFRQIENRKKFLEELARQYPSLKEDC